MLTISLQTKNEKVIAILVLRSSRMPAARSTLAVCKSYYGEIGFCNCNFEIVLSMWAKSVSLHVYKLEILEAEICVADCIVKFLSPGFPYNFGKK